MTIKLHEMQPRPLLVVNGQPLHYHEAEISQPELDEMERELWDVARPPQIRPHSYYRATFPFHLSVGVYLAPATEGRSLWRIREFRAESWAKEKLIDHTGHLRAKGRLRPRAIFEAAIEPYKDFPRIEIREHTPAELTPRWMSGYRCQFMEDHGPTTMIGAPPELAHCYRPAAYVIMWLPVGLPGSDHFGYICEHHKPQFEEFIQRHNPAAADDYKYRRLRP